MTVLLTRLRAPRLSTALVQRPRLLAQLSQAVCSAHSTTLVIAPAGYGKTTLACQWADYVAHSAPAMQLVWMSLDASDNAPQQLLGGLAVALGVDVALSGDIEPAHIINHLAQSPRETTIVFDDFHLLHDERVHAAVQMLLERLPEHAHLVIASREQPPLAFGRLRATGRLTELGSDDLGFTLDEATTLLNGILALDLPKQTVAALHRHMEQWAAGLTLAGLAIKNGACAVDIDGAHPFVQDYLREEVFLPLPDAWRTFLLDTACLDVVHPLYCDALTGRDDSALVLRQLTRSNVFVRADATAQHRYRYHALFREFLRRERAQLHERSFAPQSSLTAHTSTHVNPDALSGREGEVMQLISEGMSNADIARRLCIAPGTVKRHVHNIFAKLNARTRAEAIALAKGQ